MKLRLFATLIASGGILIGLPVLSSEYSRVPGCDGVYKFYGAPVPDYDRGMNRGYLYYISSTKNDLMACFKGSRRGGATPIKTYIDSPDISGKDRKLIQDVADQLGFRNAHIHSLGI